MHKTKPSIQEVNKKFKGVFQRPKKLKWKRGRPRKGEIREVKEPTRLQSQLSIYIADFSNWLIYLEFKCIISFSPFIDICED